MARGWRDTHYFTFSRLPLLEEKSKLFNLFSDCPRMTCFSCLASLVSSICVWGRQDSFLPYRYSANGICVQFYWDGSEFPVTKTETERLGDLPA